MPMSARGRSIAWVVMTVLAWSIGAYAWAVLLVPAAGAPFLKNLLVSVPIAVRTHLGGGGLALLLGPTQFNRRLRTRYLALHRWMGRGYVIVCLAGAVAGARLAVGSMGGLVAHVGFGLLAIAWFGTTTKAYLAIRAGDRATHYRWMVRSFALTYAAVTLRIYLPTSFAVGIPFEQAYPVIAWLCWVPNLLAAEWLLRRRVAEPADAAARTLGVGRPATA